MNSQKIAILADSCCDIPVQEALAMGIYLVPLIISTPDGDFEDGFTIFSDDVYRRQAAGEDLKTSLPTGLTVEQALDRIKADGYEKVAAVMLSSGLSGTYNLLRITAESRSDLEIAVFDSLSASVGVSMILRQLVEDLDGGMDWDTLTRQRIPTLLQNTSAFFSVETLDHLQKGGRIGKITAMAGTMLNIKPILTFAEDGQLTSMAKARGTKQVQSKFIETLRQLKGEHRKFNLAIVNGGASEWMDALCAQIEEELPGYDHLYQAQFDATLSVYIGSGVLGAAITVLD